MPEVKKVKVTIELDVEVTGIDSRGDEEWAVFNAVADHFAEATNADDFYGKSGVEVDYIVVDEE